MRIIEFKSILLFLVSFVFSIIFYAFLIVFLAERSLLPPGRFSCGSLEGDYQRCNQSIGILVEFVQSNWPLGIICVSICLAGFTIKRYFSRPSLLNIILSGVLLGLGSLMIALEILVPIFFKSPL